jgi:hypothetical protein
MKDASHRIVDDHAEETRIPKCHYIDLSTWYLGRLTIPTSYPTKSNSSTHSPVTYLEGTFPLGCSRHRVRVDAPHSVGIFSAAALLLPPPLIPALVWARKGLILMPRASAVHTWLNRRYMLRPEARDLVVNLAYKAFGRTAPLKSSALCSSRREI